MRRRVSVTLPAETLRLIDRAAGRGNRSPFINELVMHFLRARGGAKLRRLLKEGAQVRAARDLALVAE